MKDWIKGMDLSSLLEVERCGGKFYNHGKEGDAMSILKEYGMNLVRLRLWNHPFSEEGVSFGAGGNDLETVLSLARRARESGTDWFLDFHYSDCWADPGKQILPRAWKGLKLEELIEAVYSYTASVLQRCRRENLVPGFVSVGNEASKGILWPYGEVPHYENLARLISAGIRAVREWAPEAEVMIHLDNGTNQELYRTWFDQYLKYSGADFDYIGLSYYPFWHGTLPMLKENMTSLALRYHKKLLVAETSMGFTLEDYQEYEKLPAQKRKGMAATARLAQKVPFPMTPKGQAQFMRELMEVIQEVPEGLGKGFCYWEAAWIPVQGSQWATEDALKYMKEKGPGGNEWANQALFDYDGNALEALEVIREV